MRKLKTGEFLSLRVQISHVFSCICGLNYLKDFDRLLCVGGCVCVCVCARVHVCVIGTYMCVHAITEAYGMFQPRNAFFE